VAAAAAAAAILILAHVFAISSSIPITVIRQITAQSSSGQIAAFYVALRAHPVVMAIKRLLLKTD